MKQLFFIFCMAAIACCSSKTKLSKTVNQASTDKSIPVTGNLPACIDSLISVFKKEEPQNPPRKIISYTYQGKTVYYVTAPCCDFFTDLYNNDCVLMGHPDGGFTGRGDGGFPDFEKEKSNEKLVWEDKRK